MSSKKILVGPSVGREYYALQQQGFAGLAPAEVSLRHARSLLLNPYPDPDSVQADEQGYVPGYAIPPQGKCHLVHILNEDGSAVIVEDAGHGPLPSPDLAYEVVSKAFAPVPPVDGKGPLTIVTMNMEFLDQSKAEYFRRSLPIIFQRGDIILTQEAAPDGAAVMARLTGYKFQAGKPNDYGQGNIIYRNPARVSEYAAAQDFEDVANVGGISNLRGMETCFWEDMTTGDRLVPADEHFKAMIPDEASTSSIRTEQAARSVAHLTGFEKVIVAGDFNCNVNSTHDLDPFWNAGFERPYSSDATATQERGGHFDWFLLYRMGNLVVGDIIIVPLFRSKKIGRGITDHAVVIMKLYEKDTAPSGGRVIELPVE